jgi:hypothetical protein
MSTLDRREDNKTEPKLPRAPTMPQASQEWDDEALRRHQRDVDRERKIEQLEAERDQWRRDCLSAQQGCQRLDAKLAQESRAHDATVDKLRTELDQWKWEYGEIWNHMVCGAKIFNEMLNYKHRMQRQSEPSSGSELQKLMLSAVSDALQPAPENKRVVAAGPKE